MLERVFLSGECSCSTLETEIIMVVEESGACFEPDSHRGSQVLMKFWFGLEFQQKRKFDVGTE